MSELPNITNSDMTFPELNYPNLERTNIIDHLSKLFSNQRKVVIVIGPEGIGKTTLLAQFAKANYHRTISFFIGSDYWGSHPRQFLINALAQMSVLLQEDYDLDNYNFENLCAQFNDSYYKLAKKARRNSFNYYFVIDGLDLIKQAKSVEQTLLDILPKKPLQGFYILGSCTTVDDVEFGYKWEPTLSFSPTETETYLGDVIDNENARKIYDVCKGFPGYLAEKRREIESGTPLDEVLTNLPSEFLSLMRYQWKRLPEDTLTKNFLSLITYSSFPLTTLNIEEILEIDQSTVNNMINYSSVFIKKDVKNNCIKFITDVHKKFASEELSQLRYLAEDKLIKYYQNNSTTKESHIALPILFERTEKYNNLKDLIVPEYLIKSLEIAKDANLPLRDLRVLSQMAYANKDFQSLAIYIIAIAICKNLTTSPKASRNEIRAITALGEYEKCMSLAYQCILLEDRLYLLSKACKYMNEKGIQIPTDIITTIEGLVSEIDPTEKEKKLLETISDLFCFSKEIAINLLQKVLVNKSGQSMDWALAELTIKLSDIPASTEVANYIEDEKLKYFTRAITTGFAKTSAEKLLDELENIDDVSTKIFIIRSWCIINKNDTCYEQIIHKALEILIATNQSSTPIRVLRQLAEVLKYAVSEEGMFSAIDKFDLLKESALQQPKEEAIWLECILAGCEAKFNVSIADERLYNTYFMAEEIDELDIKCASLARIIVFAKKIIPEDFTIIQDATNSLQSYFAKLIADSSDHLTITTSLLEALTETNIELSVQFASSLNTLQRRIIALGRILINYAKRGMKSSDIPYVLKVLGTIPEKNKQDEILVGILYYLKKNKTFWESKECLDLKEIIMSIDDPKNMTLAFCYLYCGLLQGNHDEKKFCIGELIKAWGNIDSEWNKVSIGFNIVTDLAEYDLDLSKYFFEETQKEKQLSPFFDVNFTDTYVFCLRLAIVTIEDLTKDDTLKEIDEWIIQRIKAIPCPSTQCMLLSELALTFLRLKNRSKFEEISRLVISKFDCNFSDSEALSKALVVSAPCLYLYEQNLCKTMFINLSVSLRDEAWQEVLRWLITNRLPWQPVEFEHYRNQLDLETVLKYIDILEHITNDEDLYSSIKRLIDNLITNDNYGNKLYMVEKHILLVAERLKTIIDTKLPDTLNIRHDGWKLVCLSQLTRLHSIAKNSSPYRAKKRWEDICYSWKEIIDSIENIPNAADKMFVFIECGSIAYDIDNKYGKEFLEKSKACIDLIPNLYDRALRSYELASTWKKVDNSESAKYFLQQAFSMLSLGSRGRTRDILTGKILEVAHSLDPEFATHLASRIDNPFTREEAEEYFISDDLRRKPNNINQIDKNDRKIIAKAAYKLLETTYSGRGVIQHEDVIGGWLLHGLIGDFDSNKWIVAWFLEQSIQRTRGMHTPSLRFWWSSIIEWLDCSRIMASRVRGTSIMESHKLVANAKDENKIYFSIGQRKEALTYLTDWISNENHEYIKIYEPYFSVKELELIKHINPNTRVWIFTSWKGQKNVAVGSKEIENIYREAWDKISDQAPPEVQVNIIGLASNVGGPIHDRYIVSKTGGLRLGTSINGLGGSDTSFNVLDEDEKLSVENEHINKLLLNPPRLHKGEPVIWRTFNI